MKRVFVFISVILASGLLGYVGRGAIAAKFLHATLNPEFSRAETAVALFETYCGPFARLGLQIQPSGMERRALMPASKLWIDPRSRVSLSYDKFHCQVSDAFAHFNDIEREEFRKLTINMVAEKFPKLGPDPRAQLAGQDEWLIWARYPVRDPRRQVVYLQRFQNAGPESATALVFGKKQR